MIGLPAEPGLVGTAFLAAGAIVGIAIGIAAWRRLFGAFGEGRAAQLVRGVVVVALTAGTGIAPFVAWRIVEDIRVVADVTRADAEVIGALGNEIDATVFDDFRAAIRAEETYYVDTSKTIDPTRAGAFRQWSLGALLPRVRVLDPADADWVVTWGLDPRQLGVSLARTEMVRPPAGGFPAYYLARVRR